MTLSIAVLAIVIAAWPAAAALAPHFRWQLEFPAFVLEPDPSARGLALTSLALDLRCAGECVLTSVYTLSAGGVSRARLVLPAAPEPAPRIEGSDASLRIGDVRRAPPRPSPPPGPARIGGDTLPPRDRADVATRAIDVAFTRNAARITLVQRLPPSVRGDGTDNAMAVMRIEIGALGRWTRAPGFELSLGFASEPDPRATPPRNLAGAFACLRYDGEREATLLVRGTAAAVPQEMRLASPLPHSLACLIGSETVITRELR
jgi:hypothetical protein